jgi:hypothetical protein
MTIDELIEEAKDCGPWVITPAGFIRREQDDCCPMAAVCRKRTGQDVGNHNFGEMRRVLGMTDEGVNMAALAADKVSLSRWSVFYPIRVSMLVVLGAMLLSGEKE